MSEEKKSDILYINHKGELLIWLIVILILSTIFFFFKIHKTEKNNEFNLFIPDVDGLIVGSPVRAMGMEIGHITEIKPTGEEVFIRFIIKDKDLKIPQGTVATVEFSGLAGSKSLELYLPDKTTYIDSTVPIITVNNPKRLNEAVGLLNEMFKKIGNIIAVSTRFGHKINEIDFSQSKNGNYNAWEFLQFMNDSIDKSQKRADNIRSFLDDRQK